ncbi:MAG TPA: cupin domain-containing protein [Rhizomicrobium sp.]|nr:cupin domain-containing protein [Rhizomicrobium sp.]
MKIRIILAAAMLLLPLSAQAQTAAPPPPLKTFLASADIQALEAKAKTMPAAPLISQPIVGTGGYRASLEYRSGAPAPASIHDSEAELMVVVDGSGTITMGGTLVDGKRTNPANQSGSSITGGAPQHVTKGDMLIVPQGVAHQIAADSGVAVVLMTFHVPSPWPGK